MTLSPAIFFDKDGTLVPDIPYNVDPARMQLAPGAAVGLPRLASAGFRLVVVSNQSGIARGYFSESDLQPVEKKLRNLLQEIGVPLSGFYHCPHHPEGAVKEYAIRCDCRKPKPGLLERGAEELRIDLTRSWMIGDILDDVEAGKTAGCRTILLLNGGETQWHKSQSRKPDFVARDLEEASATISHVTVLDPTNYRRALQLNSPAARWEFGACPTTMQK